ncbi:MAG TPA: CheR family methyltransferase [Trichocoleus sp.]
MKDFPVSSVIELISNTIGVHIRSIDYEPLEHKILTRVKALGFASIAAYYQLLVSHANDPCQPEWCELVNSLTITESHFFRDQGQFLLLREQILPEIIRRKMNAPGSDRLTLRLWSAGCSTGEEAHSLAILLTELIPDSCQWNISILGTDINQTALQRARQGIYSNWSFRSVPVELKQRYFQAHRHEWKIAAPIQAMVKFKPKNLVYDEYFHTDSDIHNFDLILCRNVFIYFNPEAIDRVIKKFYSALIPGGYLLTGHAELQGQNLQQFEILSFPESVIYQRRQYFQPVESCSNQSNRLEKPFLKIPVVPSFDPAICLSAFSSVPLPQKPAVLTALVEKQPGVEDELAEIRQLLKQKAYLAAIEQARAVISSTPKNALAYYLIAQAYANLGDYTQAVFYSEQSIQIDISTANPYYLMAQIAEEQGEVDRAKALLKKVIYLMPTSAYAYAELGFLYYQEGSLERARRNWQSALSFLQNLNVNEPIYEGLIVSELQARLTKYLSLQEQKS